jgi:hypothetical protein
MRKLGARGLSLIFDFSLVRTACVGQCRVADLTRRGFTRAGPASGVLLKDQRPIKMGVGAEGPIALPPVRQLRSENRGSSRHI